MKIKHQHLLCCDYGEWDDARSVPFLIVPSMTLAYSISREITSNPDSPYRQYALKTLGLSELPPDADISVQVLPTVESVESVQEPLTKEELMRKLLNGTVMADLFDFRAGQECEIFKAESFAPGPQILYIPDIAFNGIPVNEPVVDSCQQIEDILSQCYTGDDFIEECDGDVELAERLFNYCDWQHPSSALPEVDDNEDEK